MIRNQTGITSAAKSRITLLSVNPSWKNTIINVIVVIKGSRKNDKLFSNLCFLKFWNKLRNIVRVEREMKKQNSVISNSVNKGI